MSRYTVHFPISITYRLGLPLNNLDTFCSCAQFKLFASVGWCGFHIRSGYCQTSCNSTKSGKFAIVSLATENLVDFAAA